MGSILTPVVRIRNFVCMDLQRVNMLIRFGDADGDDDDAVCE